MTRADFELAYGRGVLALELPTDAEPALIRKAVLPKLPDNALAIRNAFDHPIAEGLCLLRVQGRALALLSLLHGFPEAGTDMRSVRCHAQDSNRPRGGTRLTCFTVSLGTLRNHNLRDFAEGVQQS
jgi:hypothetical protein